MSGTNWSRRKKSPGIRPLFRSVRRTVAVTDENHWLTKSGQRRLLAWSFSTLPDETGRPRYLIATGLDITEQHRAEEALRA
ncbi:MAG: PAS domain S-box protein [Anaerolineae bacterium]